MNNKRLEMCAEFVSGKGIVCDVGTDHAYLAIELIKSGKCSKVIASDINEKPLESAKKNVADAGLSDKIDLVLSDGLENINLDGVSDIVIAGMGGETIVHVLESADFVDIRLILQPMTKPEILRKWLCENGFYKLSEKAVEDGGKIYTVICADYESIEHESNMSELTEIESISGFFAYDDETGKKYCQQKAESLAKASESLRKSGRINEAVHYSALSRKLVEGIESKSSIREIYNFLDEKYPFSLQEQWDNSGLLVNSFSTCSGILLALDITNEVITEAIHKETDLIISHHPVIFHPLKKIDFMNPVYRLIQHNISAICMHTNLDIAEGGTNTTIVKKITEKFAVTSTAPLEDSGLGCIIEFASPHDIDELAHIFKEIFSIDRIRVSRYGKRIISRLAICSGSGGSLLNLADKKDCDALLTGDVKHDVWIDANNSYMTVFDCGHFHTENIVLWELRRVLEEKFPLLDIEIAESSADPCIYL
ncbi:MAG: Nif3-like dinuclear metal center hexameric protein [Ruminococcus sp.]|nr:Nif3-like dinuclear metal center hexameric protein [Ruminococcus sp.]